VTLSVSYQGTTSYYVNSQPLVTYDNTSVTRNSITTTAATTATSSSTTTTTYVVQLLQVFVYLFLASSLDLLHTANSLIFTAQVWLAVLETNLWDNWQRLFILDAFYVVQLTNSKHTLNFSCCA